MKQLIKQDLDLDTQTYNFLASVMIYYPNAYHALLRNMKIDPNLGYDLMKTLINKCPELKEFKPNVFLVKAYAVKSLIK